MNDIELQGTKLVEVPYFASQLDDLNKSVLIVGERRGGEGISETIKEIGFTNVTTTDIMSMAEDSWFRDMPGWKHIESDFVKLDETIKYDYIIAVSVFEHFGFWFVGNNLSTGQDDICHWNHDIVGINKACRLLKGAGSKLMVTLPAGPYMNYELTGNPWLRGYDFRRQSIVKNEVLKNGFVVINEKFFFSSDCQDWKEVGSEINNPSHYGSYNPHTPNVIWAFTISKQT